MVIVVALLPLLGGLLFLVLAAYFWWRGRQSRQWPTVIATITESTTREEDDSDTIMTYPVVRYTYTYNNQTFESGQIRIGGANGHSNPRIAEQFIADYPVGETVTVSVDPKAPHLAILVLGGNPMLVILLAILGLPFFIAGVVLLLIFG